MVVDQVLVHNLENQRVLDDHLLFHGREEPIVLQLGGSDPSLLARATKVAYDYGYTEVNLNAGCPSCRVAGMGEFGAALMRKPDRIKECLEAMASAAPVKVSLKTRLGVDELDSPEYFSSLIDRVMTAHLPNQTEFSLVVHARKAWLNGLSPAQNRTVPPLNYERAFDVCGQKSRGLVWYLNGGINTVEAAASLLAKSPRNMDGVMMGRAAMNNPCTLANADVLLYGEKRNPASTESRKALLEAYCELLNERYPVSFDSVVTTGQAALSTKPILGVFHGLPGNRLWRCSLDQLCKDASLRRELGISGIIQHAMQEMKPEVLNSAIVTQSGEYDLSS